MATSYPSHSDHGGEHRQYEKMSGASYKYDADERDRVARELEMIAIIEYRNSVRGFLVFSLLGVFILACTFGIINFLKLFLVFFDPITIAATYTVVVGITSVAFYLLVHFLYAIQWIGSDNGLYDDRDQALFIRALVNYFEPGCVYDCRIVENRRDIISLTIIIALTCGISIAIYWLGASQSSIPAYDTAEGVRYTQAQIALMMIEAIRIYAILNSLYAFYREAILVPGNVRPNVN